LSFGESDFSIMVHAEAIFYGLQEFASQKMWQRVTSDVLITINNESAQKLLPQLFCSSAAIAAIAAIDCAWVVHTQSSRATLPPICQYGSRSQRNSSHHIWEAASLK
jgi:hypothetical protein